MHQAQIKAWGEGPKLVDINPPAPTSDELRIKVEAVGIHRVVRSRASGQHYSSKALPHIPGIDGVGRTEDGKRVYFTSFTTGTLAETVNMPKSAVYALPEYIDPVQVAGAINPAMSSWMALKGRITHLPKDFTVLIVGVTSASGRVAIPLARALGAKRVIGAARNQEAMQGLGLNSTIVIKDKPEETDFIDLDDVDVVLDYVFGPLTVHLLESLKAPKPVQYVHIGALSSTMDVTIPGSVLRSKDITIRGSGPGAWSMQSFTETLPDLLSFVPLIPEQSVHVAKLANIEEAWNYKGSDRLVIVP